MMTSSILIEHLASKSPYFWVNPELDNNDLVSDELAIPSQEIYEAEKRWKRFGPLLAVLFDELKGSDGIIESELTPVPMMQEELSRDSGNVIEGQLYLKADHSLPVAGSVKARGGVYEVLCLAEELALKNLSIDQNSDYRILTSPEAKKLFSQYTVSVGSTGNLGLSIGIMASTLGFNVCVHMSSEAKTWKKKILRELGVDVVEHFDDYSGAVAAGRIEAGNSPFSYFVDDENSERLFLGYSVAALRLEQQLAANGVVVDGDHPVFVYIPCGVGGAPGGISFGLKVKFGSAVHCFFAEPTEAPCMLLNMAAGYERDLNIFDIGLKLDTEADGLAVPQASRLVTNMMKTLLSGVCTVTDEALFKYLYQLGKTESIKIEPSAAAGFAGPGMLLGSAQGRAYLAEHGLEAKMQKATHIVWTTGGRFVPSFEYEEFYSKGKMANLSGSQNRTGA